MIEIQFGEDLAIKEFYEWMLPLERKKGFGETMRAKKFSKTSRRGLPL
jgi:hypothetical protein